jgi:homocysteine S-methyltransferase
MAGTGLPYLLGFPMRPGGTLLDGTPLAEAVERLDAAAEPPALGYMGHCVHPSVFEAAMEAAFPAGVRGFGRWVGLQANASDLAPEALDGSDRLHGDGPVELAWGIARSARRWGLRVVGGCCGTDDRLIAPLGEGLRSTD